MLCRISEMYVSDESHTDGRILVYIDVVLPKMDCVCKLMTYFSSSSFLSFMWHCILSENIDVTICVAKYEI